MTDRTMTDRPSMKQDDHEDHNMPESEHDGVEITDPNDQYNKNTMLRAMEVRSTLGKIQRDNKARY